MPDRLTPEMLLRAYALGIFPMAQGRADPAIHWVDPRLRGILPLDALHVSRSLRRRILRGDVTIRTDTAFADVVTGCADRPDTWINAQIFDLYLALHASGHAHSLEVWRGTDLIGGVYGVVQGGAFFGESMFSRATDASKIALAFLVHRLNAGGFALFDTQFLTTHLASLGAVEISRHHYHRRLAAALAVKATFDPPGYSPVASSVSSGAALSSTTTSDPGTTQRNTQTS